MDDPTSSKRYFTLAEANAALETVRPRMQEAHNIRTQILKQRPEVWPAIARSVGNGGNATLSKLVREFDRLDRVVHEILAAGAEIKDINSGLLDFPAMRQGREVCLCWKLGEPAVQFWHEVDAGFAGRQPIESF